MRLRQLGEHEPHVVHEGDTIRRHVIDERDPVFVGHGTAFIATTKPWSGCHPRRFSGSADPPLPEVTIPPVHTRVNPLSRPANDGSYHTIGCRKLDLFGREVVAVDGTPMKAVNSTDRSFILEKLKSLTNRLPTIQGEQRQQILERFAAMYKPAIGTGPVMDYMAGTGVDSLKSEDILKVAPQKVLLNVEYPNISIARKLKGIAQLHLADVGSRIFYCDHSTFDTHVGQNRGTAFCGPR